ncbi:hypothetical protein CONPUDRAFT_118373 [Coniophora puteana RWD-64-598 SS2]|uniref:Uncharacterized protein n=1 Tax=Coniophora puteana (strain RWD-64-598) TaxID=741705 RepID=A0A5M3N3Q5_CONPW|nr:uncharacterized protein CONPUDRAFT_118373 [Coniophora puteana RWD-64-598 SS2]EIW85475.1 hypothetical protein CONPUDRAFT_118373 [Coniophora puteana RWD-64-598 SS2]
MIAHEYTAPPQRPAIRRKSSAQNLLTSFKPPQSATSPGFSAPTPTQSYMSGHQKEADAQSQHSDSHGSSSTYVGSGSSSVNGTPSLPAGTNIEYIRDLVQKRIITLTYLRNVHEGQAHWFHTIHLSRAELNKHFNNSNMKKRTQRFTILAMSLSNLLDIPQGQDFLRGLVNTVTEFETGKIDSVKEEAERPKIRLFKTKVGKRQAGGFAEYTMPYQDGSDSYLVAPHLPFALDYHETLLSLLDVLSETYNKISRVLGPSPFPHGSGQHMMGPLGLLAPHPGVSYLFNSNSSSTKPGPSEGGDSSLWGIAHAGYVGVGGPLAGAGMGMGGLGSPPPSWTSGLGDMVIKADAKMKRLTTILLKELDEVARSGIKDELSSLNPLLRNLQQSFDNGTSLDFEG